MSTLVLAGDLHNNLARGTVTVSSEDSKFPATSLYDEQCWERFLFGSNAADPTVTLDANLIENGGFETPTLDGWTADHVGASNTAEEEGSEVNSGSKAAKLTLTTAGAGNRASLYWDVEMRAGEYGTVVAALEGDGTVTVALRVKNLDTGRWLDSSGVWQDSESDVATESGAAYSEKSRTFQVEDFETVRGATCTIRVTVILEDDTTPGVAYVDDVYLWPHWNFAGVFGHNLRPVTCQLHSSTDGFSASDDLVASPAITHWPSFYHYQAAMVTARYVRLQLVGTNKETPSLNQFVVGQAVPLSRGINYGSTMSFKQPGNVFRGRGGTRRTSRIGTQLIRSFAVQFRYKQQSDLDEALQELFARAHVDKGSVIFVPRSNEAHAIFGAIDNAETSFERVTGEVWDVADVTFVEDGFSVQTS